jgi:legumain
VANFGAVLTGKKNEVPAGKPVLTSTANDNVFVNFVDHGGVGLIAFPRQHLPANQLLQFFTTMHQQKMYKQLVFYVEACESGSMFLQ